MVEWQVLLFVCLLEWSLQCALLWQRWYWWFRSLLLQRLW